MSKKSKISKNRNKHLFKDTITLKIIFTTNKKQLPSDAIGYYEGTPPVKKITLLKTKDFKDTTIHELCHFILNVLDEGGFSHRKKFNQLYKFLKKLIK